MGGSGSVSPEVCLKGAAGLDFKLVHSHDWQAGAGCSGRYHFYSRWVSPEAAPVSSLQGNQLAPE